MNRVPRTDNTTTVQLVLPFGQASEDEPTAADLAAIGGR